MQLIVFEPHYRHISCRYKNTKEIDFTKVRIDASTKTARCIALIDKRSIIVCCLCDKPNNDVVNMKFTATRNKRLTVIAGDSPNYYSANLYLQRGMLKSVNTIRSRGPTTLRSYDGVNQRLTDLFVQFHGKNLHLKTALCTLASHIMSHLILV
jgi:hypothetical protein